MKRGKKKGSRTVVVHVYLGNARAEAHAASQGGALPEAATAGPRVGLVVSKAVGNAVTRHRVSRLVRHCAAYCIGSRPAPSEFRDCEPLEIPVGASIVIRALPASAHATTEELLKDVHSCIRRALN